MAKFLKVKIYPLRYGRKVLLRMELLHLFAPI
jgi:hypothetical protein